ncbi:MAG: hypothetical protein RID53_27935 [Coleofasciculus sp. B1-GNL1-01]|uniref:hypothetical protein n=1 Tax=Coleofasciculus sp. B1-GNL1-01 TaxID=3068484 RepID=UPI0032F451CB
MIEIKPIIQHPSICPYCQSPLKPIQVYFMGMHVMVNSKCVECQTELLESLRVSHAIHKPYQIDYMKGSLFGYETNQVGLATHLLKSIQNPELERLNISKDVFRVCHEVIILNCIDYLYGHCLLKLLNAQRHLDHHSDSGLIIIIPQFLRWMVPEGVAEVWTVPIPLKKGQCYYPSFAEFVNEELKRFDKIYISKAYSHPCQFDITQFTGVEKHRFEQKDIKITFIWREDRPWCSMSFFRLIRKLRILHLGLLIQNWRVKRLFKKIRLQVSEAKFVVAGLGTQTQFPKWIEDVRIDKFDEKIEKQMCKLYSESRLVIGVHGSNMLLPSAHAGMTLDLMPPRWGNFAQDILYQENDSRLASFRYRYLPIETSIRKLADIASSMIIEYWNFVLNMTADKPQ